MEKPEYSAHKFCSCTNSAEYFVILDIGHENTLTTVPSVLNSISSLWPIPHVEKGLILRPTAWWTKQTSAWRMIQSWSPNDRQSCLQVLENRLPTIHQDIPFRKKLDNQLEFGAHNQLMGALGLFSRRSADNTLDGQERIVGRN